MFKIPPTNLLFFLLLFFLSTANSFAADSEDVRRKKVFTAKARKFYNIGNVSHSILFSGNRDSDQNSKEYHIDLRYYYRSDRQMHEFYFLHEQNYANSGSGKNKVHLDKKSELYDAIISNKFMIADSNNYTTFYGRANYDDLSSYYYDYRVAGGVGRRFFNDKLEFDTSIGYSDIKIYNDYQVFLLPSVRLNLRLTKDLTFTHRGYLFVNNNSLDNDLRTTLKYRLSKKVSLVLNHIYEQRRYDEAQDNIVINQSRKFLSIGLAFDLN